nr:hypothetical protein [Tanacetum cinerariifolium]
MSEMKQVDQYAQAISSNPATVDRYMYNKLREAIQKSIQSHNEECREEAQAKKEEYIDLVDSTMRTIIREEVKTQLPQILPKAISDFATPATASLTEHELTKILLDKIEERKSHLRADYKRELYDTLVKYYNNDKDLFETYGEVFTLKRSQDEKDKNQDLSARSDRGTKKRSLARNLSHKKIQGQRKESHQAPLKIPLTLIISHLASLPMKRSQVTQLMTPECKRVKILTWISVTTRVEKPHTSFDEFMDTPIDFSAFVINRLNITNLTQELLVGPKFNLLKGTCKSLTELEYYFEESSKATTEQLDWHNLEGKSYPFDLRKPLPLIPDHRGRQVIPQDYFINNDLEYLKGGSLRRQYSTFVIKTKTATYEIKWIKDLVHNLWSPVKVVYEKHAYWVTRLKIIKKYDYGHLDEIEVHREDHQLYTFKEDERYDLNVALRMFTRRIVIQRQVEDLQLGIRMKYLPKRKWSGLDKRRARVMIHNIDKILFERRLTRNMEKFVGGREYGNDLRLLEQTILLCRILSYLFSEYVVDTYGRNWKEDDALVDIILEDLWQKSYNQPRLLKMWMWDLLAHEEVKSS